MATITVFDPVTTNSKTITTNVRSAVIQQDENGQIEYYITLVTTAKKVSGADISDHVIKTLSDLARGTTQQDGVTATPYTTLTDSVRDHVLNMIEGSGPSGDEMDFTS